MESFSFYRSHNRSFVCPPSTADLPSSRLLLAPNNPHHHQGDLPLTGLGLLPSLPRCISSLSRERKCGLALGHNDDGNA
nr:hypothetical protein HmN_001002900 [Hymenolepis microstoma]